MKVSACNKNPSSLSTVVRIPIHIADIYSLKTLKAEDLQTLQYPCHPNQPPSLLVFKDKATLPKYQMQKRILKVSVFAKPDERVAQSLCTVYRK